MAQKLIALMNTSLRLAWARTWGEDPRDNEEVRMTDGIRKISSELSAGVQAESEALGAMDNEHREMREAASAEQYWKTGGSLAPYEYEMLFADFEPGSRFLDVGVGFGQSSIFLASKGHKVVAIEPAISLCEIIKSAADEFHLDLEVVQGVGEDLSKLGRSDFDAVIFNASLHHCDDPIKAISEAYLCLKPGGRIYLVNEYKLQPWHTQKGFYKKLVSNPIEMGHYGGNEHAYHNSGYAGMLKTKFEHVVMLPPRRKPALDSLRAIVNARLDGSWVQPRTGPVLARFAFYIVRARVHSISWLYSALARASIVPVHFRGDKPINDG